jgi:uracil-DNA glycosylase
MEEIRDLNSLLGDYTTKENLSIVTPILSKLAPYSKILCPKPENVFRAFLECPKSNLKAVFLGLDPYPQPGVATGIMFGNKEGTKFLSPSLCVIRDSVFSLEDYQNNLIFDVTLESWCHQGILMLNSALTTEVNAVGVHSTLWEPFTAQILKEISNSTSNIVYVLFGRQAEKFKDYINIDNNKNTVFVCSHPSYYARREDYMPSTVFKNTNIIIEMVQHKEPIKWYEYKNK